MIYFAIIAILIAYANKTDIQEIFIDLLSILVLPLAFIWLIIFSIINANAVKKGRSRCRYFFLIRVLGSRQ
ncbi:hypothetical protein ACFOHW_04325 [Paenibacillus abyssi]|uniref:Uncharacterized protein n=1 Tax=Paenibacillus abyssi TaxID=1340531 RepID=A0A917LF59_9BACL|nr:hypothetical protein GCM10010916_37170 [Paenibacillus abyssi]